MEPAQPPSTWRLSEAGRAAAVLLAERLTGLGIGAICSSDEPKAAETGSVVAERLGLTLRQVPGLREHAREGAGLAPTTAAFEAAVARMLAMPSSRVFGEETADEAHVRFTAALAELMTEQDADVAVVSHGTVISLYVARANDLEPFALWCRLGLPSMVITDWPSGRSLELVEQI